MPNYTNPRAAALIDSILAPKKGITEAGNTMARSPESARVSPNPEAYYDDYGTRSDYLRRMDMKSRETSVWEHGPTKAAKKAAAIVDAANKARGRGKP